MINHLWVFNVINFGHLVTYRLIDRGLIEMVGPRGAIRGFKRLAQEISNLQSGMVFNYVLIMIIFTVLFIVAI